MRRPDKISLAALRRLDLCLHMTLRMTVMSFQTFCPLPRHADARRGRRATNHGRLRKTRLFFLLEHHGGFVHVVVVGSLT
jgi:hypothetical protein